MSLQRSIEIKIVLYLEEDSMIDNINLRDLSLETENKFKTDPRVHSILTSACITSDYADSYYNKEFVD